MKKFLSRVPKKLVAAVAGIAVLVGVGAAAHAAFGPSREIRTWSTQENGFDHVTFNSYTGVSNGIGNEQDFLRGVQVGRDNTWSDPVANVTQDAEVEAKIYIHNNADPLLNDNAGQTGIARNVVVSVALPSGAKQTQQISSAISADNAAPKTITDTLDITGANNGFFELAFVPGSAKMVSQGVTVSLTTAQEQELLSGAGVNIGDQKGCFDYVREITFRVKVKMPNISIAKQVRVDGTGPGNWKESVEAKPGDTVEWNITASDIGKTNLTNVMVVDNVPANLTVVPGTVKLYNTNYPSGYTYPDTAIQANGRQVNVNSGSYGPNGASDVTFKTKIADADKLPCGTTTITNEAFVTPEGFGAVRDVATVIVKGNTCTTVQNPVCNALTLVKGDNRTVTASVAFSANGHTFNNATIDFGDKTAPFIGNNLTNGKVVTNHTYATDGPFTVKAAVIFDGASAITSEQCEQKVSFTATPTELPNTGIGSTVGIFTGTATLATAAYYVVARRRALN